MLNSESGRAAQSGAETRADDDVHWQRFSVPFEFPVVFTRGVFDTANQHLRDVLTRLEAQRKHRVIVFFDDGLLSAVPDLVQQIEAYADAHADVMQLVCEPQAVPGGERIKSDLHFIERMQRAVFDHHVDRHSYIIALGGGAVLDAVGLVAATSHRGIRHIRIPTTVLAQDDSGVGVKNGVNLYDVKNFVGTFAPPFAVINDLDFALALPERDKIAGMAEAVKVALIRDGEFFRWIEREQVALATFEADAMAKLIRRCAELHMHQIGHGGDPFESGSARPLDYGHWSAHKLESITRHRVRHGEAVAIGMALDAHYSVLAGLLPAGEDERLCTLLEFLGFTLWHPAMSERSTTGKLRVLEGLEEFREHLGGELTITLLQSIGQGVEVHEMDADNVLAAIAWLESRQAT